MRKKNTKIQCDSCGGTGRKELSNEFEDTLNVVRELHEPTSRDVAKRLKLQQSAAINRLMFLVGKGLLKRNKGALDSSFRFTISKRISA